MALTSLVWYGRWMTTPLLFPLFLLVSVFFAIPTFYKEIGLMWIHPDDIDKLDVWWRYIPFINYIILLIGWLINIMGLLMKQKNWGFRSA